MKWLKIGTSIVINGYIIKIILEDREYLDTILLFIVFMITNLLLLIVTNKSEIVVILITTYICDKLFSTNNILEFFLYYEVILIPLYYLIYSYGDNNSKLIAARSIFIYTSIGGILWLSGIVYLGTVSDYSNIVLNREQQIMLFPLFYIPLFIKTPQIPFHIWLPLAHSSAPTSTSIILASIVLKFSTFAAIKWLIMYFPLAIEYYKTIIWILVVFSIIYSNIVTLVQTDIKRIIAYSSIGHCSFTMLGILNSNYIGMYGSILLMISHAIVSGLLFYIFSIMYNRYKTREIYYYSGLVNYIPIIATIFLLFTLFNVSLPPYLSFHSETDIIISSYINSFSTGLIPGIATIITLVYGILVFARIFLNINYVFSKSYDISRVEYNIIVLHILLFVLFSIDCYY